VHSSLHERPIVRSFTQSFHPVFNILIMAAPQCSCLRSVNRERFMFKSMLGQKFGWRFLLHRHHLVSSAITSTPTAHYWRWWKD